MVAVGKGRFASAVRLVVTPVAVVDAAVRAPALPRAVPIALVPFGEDRGVCVCLFFWEKKYVLVEERCINSVTLLTTFSVLSAALS